MNASTTLDSASRPARLNGDRIGVIASTLCAIHCAVTPVLFIALPAFGEVWSHPAAHWAMAVVVVPVAGAMTFTGYRRHRRSWIVASGGFGIAFVLLGAAVPYLKQPPAPSILATPTAASETGIVTRAVGEPIPQPEDGAGEPFVWVAGQQMPGSGCVDSCCPSLQTGADGGRRRLHVPLASIVTTLGGLALILTHVGNLCCCPGCRLGKHVETGPALPAARKVSELAPSPCSR